MPVVLVAAPDDPDAASLVTGVAGAVAAALGLGDGDVIATHVPTGTSAASGGSATATSAWPVVWLHGSARDPERMADAAEAAAGSVRGWCADRGLACEGVWTQWLLPT